MHNMMFMLLLIQDTGVHALCNVCHVDVERISKRKPGELVHSETPCFFSSSLFYFCIDLCYCGFIFMFALADPCNGT